VAYHRDGSSDLEAVPKTQRESCRITWDPHRDSWQMSWQMSWTGKSAFAHLFGQKINSSMFPTQVGRSLKYQKRKIIAREWRKSDSPMTKTLFSRRIGLAPRVGLAPVKQWQTQSGV
jgi:hypothetical protein